MSIRTFCALFELDAKTTPPSPDATVRQLKKHVRPLMRRLKQRYSQTWCEPAAVHHHTIIEYVLHADQKTGFLMVRTRVTPDQVRAILGTDGPASTEVCIIEWQGVQQRQKRVFVRFPRLK